MQVTIPKQGNSQAVTKGDEIVIKKVVKKRRHIPLSERFKNREGKPYEITGEDKTWIEAEPVGEEVW